MIPKIIHSCWFGRGEKPKLAQKCIASWEKYCPDYEIIEWNEDNFDIRMNPYVSRCYAEKKWAFLSDYVRLWVVANHGGVYFDTDVELLKPMDNLLQNEAFFGFESEKFVASGLGFGAEKGHKTVLAMLHQYDGLMNEGETQKTIGCPTLNTQALLPFGLQLTGETQKIEGATVFSRQYLNPYDDATGRLNVTENTYSIHWYAKSALSKRVIFRSKITRIFHRIFGKDCFSRIKLRK